LTLGRRGSRAPGQNRRRPARRTGDRVMFVLCAAAGLLLVLILADVVYQVAHDAGPAISRFGLGFLGHTDWRPNVNLEGAGALIYGTAVSSGIALVLATPLGIAIGVYLSMMAPPRVRALVGPLVEMLAAVPSIIYGFWGLVVLVPFVDHLEPGLHKVLGFLPLFGPPSPIGISLLSAGLVLTVMILPIISALSRDLFLTVPRELTDGAAALGATRWEVIRGIVLPSTASGVGAAVILGLGRALGEAIAVSFVIGDVNAVHLSLLQPGSSLASRIANQFQGALNNLHVAAMFYAGLILVVIGMITSIAARAIARRFDVNRALGGGV
jgi:phosphate transport system permease protein